MDKQIDQNEKAPRLPIDLACYPGRSFEPILRSITGDQLWMCALLIELREINAKLESLIGTQKEK